MSAKKTIEDCIKAANKFNGQFLSDCYIHSKIKYKWSCDKGHEFYSRFNDVDQGHWCPYCSGNYIDGFKLCQEEAASKGGKFLSNEYIHQNIKYEWQCDKGHIWKTSFKSIRKGAWCIECSGHAPLTVEKLHKAAQKLNGYCLSEVVNFTKDKYIWKCKKGHIFNAIYGDVRNGHWCPYCRHTISKGHSEVIKYIKSLGISNFTINDRKIINPMELDIYLPEYNLGIEYNGLYPHSLKYPEFNKHIGMKSKSHIKKFKICQSKNIRLLAFFEDEWENKQDLIKAMIRWRLNKFNGVKLRLKDLKFKILHKNSDWSEFFDRNHLDSSVNASIGYSLFYNDKMITCLTLRRNFNKELEIARLATDYDYMVPGSISKLISLVKNDFKNEQLVTFSNNRLSNGDVYRKSGFNLVKELNPSYWYTDYKVRLWRFKCKRINIPEILQKYPTEQAQALGGVFSQLYLGHSRQMCKIEDYGHLKWVK